MTRRNAITLGVAGAVLLLVLVAEWIVGAARIARMEAPPPIRAAATDRTPLSADTEAGEDAVDGWLQTALARPLMTATRAPVAVSGGRAISLSSGLPRLAGTMSGPGASVAIFARDDGGHPVVVREGGTLGPYRVSHIAPNSVTLDGPSGRQVLHERFGAHTGTDTPNPAPLVMPGIVQPNFPGLVAPQLLPGQTPQQQQFQQQQQLQQQQFQQQGLLQQQQQAVQQ